MVRETSDLSDHFKRQKFDVQKVFEQFKKPLMENVFFRNYEYLINNSELIKFSKGNWKYKPYLFCKDHYKEPYFYPIILMCNNLGSVFEFTPNNLLNEIILAPKTNIITKTLSLK